jgi:hypothetical protein
MNIDFFSQFSMNIRGKLSNTLKLESNTFEKSKSQKKSPKNKS